MIYPRLTGLLSCFLIMSLSLVFPGFTASNQSPANFYYYAVIVSGDYFQEIRHYQAEELIRQVVYAPPFPPTVTIVRPDLDVIWFFDEGGWEYFASPYYPVLVANVLEPEAAALEELNREMVGVEELLGYNCEIIRFTDPLVPGWEVTLWIAPELGGFPLKKRELIMEEGTVIAEILVKVVEFAIGPVPQEYFELPPGLVPAEEDREDTNTMDQPTTQPEANFSFNPRSGKLPPDSD